METSRQRVDALAFDVTMVRAANQTEQYENEAAMAKARSGG
jgi:hypothetical protein